MKLYFDDEGFDGQLQRTVGKCDAGMANIGECLYMASRITSEPGVSLVLSLGVENGTPGH